MRRILILGAVAALMVIALGRLVLIPALGRAVMRTVEARGSELMQTAVQVESTTLDLLHRRAILSNLRVANPTGFRTDYALAIERVVVTVDPTTLRSDLVVLKEVAIEAPTLVYEFGAADNNIAVLRRAIETRVAAQDAGVVNGDNPEARLLVESLRVTHGKVRILSQFLGPQELTGRLSDIQLGAIGTTAGTSAARVVQELLATMTKGVRSNLRQLDLRGGGGTGPSGLYP